MNVNEVEPSVEEILQETTGPIVVPVRHDGPVQVRELPAVTAVINDYGLLTVPQQLLTRNPKRKRAVLVAAASFLVSTANRAGVYWPANVPLEWLSTGELWVSAAAAGNITVICEEWAD